MIAHLDGSIEQTNVCLPALYTKIPYEGISKKPTQFKLFEMWKEGKQIKKEIKRPFFSKAQQQQHQQQTQHGQIQQQHQPYQQHQFARQHH
jgi:hypothetical protein